MVLLCLFVITFSVGYIASAVVNDSDKSGYWDGAAVALLMAAILALAIRGALL